MLGCRHDTILILSKIDKSRNKSWYSLSYLSKYVQYLFNIYTMSVLWEIGYKCFWFLWKPNVCRTRNSQSGESLWEVGLFYFWSVQSRNLPLWRINRYRLSRLDVRKERNLVFQSLWTYFSSFIKYNCWWHSQILSAKELQEILSDFGCFFQQSKYKQKSMFCMFQALSTGSALGISDE